MKKGKKDPNPSKKLNLSKVIEILKNELKKLTVQLDLTNRINVQQDDEITNLQLQLEYGIMDCNRQAYVIHNLLGKRKKMQKLQYKEIPRFFNQNDLTLHKLGNQDPVTQEKNVKWKESKSFIKDILIDHGKLLLDNEFLEEMEEEGEVFKGIEFENLEMLQKRFKKGVEGKRKLEHDIEMLKKSLDESLKNKKNIQLHKIEDLLHDGT